MATNAGPTAVSSPKIPEREEIRPAAGSRREPRRLFSAHWDHEPIRLGPRAVPARSGRAKTRAWVILQGCWRGPHAATGDPSRSATSLGQLTGNGWFMARPLSFFRMHWDPEPTPNPSQEGTGADERSLPSWEGSGVGRFMARPLSLCACIG